jgi:hypothetical protein
MTRAIENHIKVRFCQFGIFLGVIQHGFCGELMAESQIFGGAKSGDGGAQPSSDLHAIMSDSADLR